MDNSNIITLIESLDKKYEQHFNSINNSFQAINERLDGIESRLSTIEKRLGKIEQRLAGIEPWISVDHKHLQPNI